MKLLFKVTLLIFIAFSIFSCKNDLVRDGKLEEYIPRNTVAVYKIKQLKSLLSDFKNNELLQNSAKDSATLFRIEKINLLKYLEPKTESILCFNANADGKLDFTFITKNSKNLFKTDSLKDKKIETFSYEDKQLQKTTINNEISYSAIVDSVFIASSSQQILESILEGKIENDEIFNKVYVAQNDSKFGLLVNNRKISLSDSTKQFDLAKWFSMDIEIQQTSLNATGIAIGRDSTKFLIDIFDEQIPQKNEIAALIPTNAKKITAFTISNSKLFLEKLASFSKIKNDTLNNTIFDAIEEIGAITMQSDKIVILKSNDENTTDAALAQFVNQGEMYRDISVNTFTSEGFFTEKLSPLITNFSAKYVFQIDSFFIFAESILTAKSFIDDYTNGNVLSKQDYFKKSVKDLGTSSSLLFINFDENVQPLINSIFKTSTETDVAKNGFENYSMAIFQLNYDRDFAHLAFVCNKISRKVVVEKNTSEAINFTLNGAPVGGLKIYNPSKNQDAAIVVQEAGNTLYSISKDGKANWTKKLDGPILGELQEVAVLKNGTNQLAFTTENSFYLVDKNGEDVPNFPIKLKDKITQPIAVFDYENNGDYRFVIIQNQGVLMYDKGGKIVKGFNYIKSKSAIVLPPKHLRFGSKDYLVFAEKNGNLNILSRTGKPRISVNKKFDFSDVNIFEEGGNFAVVTKDNNLYTISQDGKIGSKKLNISKDAKVAVVEDLIISLDNNILNINEVNTELPIGNYTNPSIQSVNGKKLITFTETSEKKVYLYDTSGKLIDGFPILGTSNAAFGADSTNKIVSATFGNGNSINLLLQ